MVKIVQIISCVQQSLNSRICEVIGSYSDSKDPNLLIVGSNEYLSWKVQDWSYVLEAHIEKNILNMDEFLLNEIFMFM